MRRRSPRSTRTDTLFPYTTLFRSTSRRLAGSATLHVAETPSAVPPYCSGSIAAAETPPPILPRQRRRGVRAVRESPRKLLPRSVATFLPLQSDYSGAFTSADRRVGKEVVSTCNSWGSPYHKK